MANSNFGKQLRILRLTCRHAETGKPVTQAQLANFLHSETGISYSSAAISDWEVGKSRINLDYRSVLCGIIKFLKKHNGIKTIVDANLLLESGNYRALNQEEIRSLFPEIVAEKETDGAIPAWAKESVIGIRKFTDSLSAWDFLKIIAWALIFLGTDWLIIPSLQFPFTSEKIAKQNMLLYTIGAFIIPLASGSMTNIHNNSYWKAKNNQKLINLWLYTFQGAYIGFHILYFVVFFIVLLLKQVNIPFNGLLEALSVLVILFASYGSAYLVPHNMWLAFNQLNLKDGGIFFSFIIVGPLWAFFFLEFYEILTASVFGILMIFTSITLTVFIQMIKKKGRK